MERRREKDKAEVLSTHFILTLIHNVKAHIRAAMMAEASREKVYHL